MKNMVMGFVNEGSKIIIGDNKIELTLTKNNIIRCNDDMVVVKNDNMISYLRWGEVEYFKL